MVRKVVTSLLRSRPQEQLFTLQCNVPRTRAFHSVAFKSAIAHPVTAHGPPPKAPSPSPEFGEASNPKQQENSAESQEEPQSSPTKRPTALKKRFWKNVDVQKKDGITIYFLCLVLAVTANLSLGGDYQVLLDKRPVRTPTKSVLSVPPTKPHLAHAIALEWDVMNNAQQALKNHLIPLTSMTARAADIAEEDSSGDKTTRNQIVKTAMRYLETDTLLCWMPEGENAAELDENGQRIESLREAQMRVAQDVIAFLSTKVWPGIEIVPVLDTHSIFPAAQSQGTKDIIQQWAQDLEAFDLAALERGILASKSLLVAARLVAEWSENFRLLQRSEPKFGIEEATEASSLEVKWQTDMWGEVEDTHDVDKEDLKRQLGSVVLLVSGEVS